MFLSAIVFYENSTQQILVPAVSIKKIFWAKQSEKF